MDAHTNWETRSSGDTFLQALERSASDDLRARGRIRSYARGTVLFHETQASDHIAMIIRGAVKVTVSAHDGKQGLLAIRGPGDLIGELGAIDGEPRFGTATALEPVEALVLSAPSFREFVTTHPSAASAVMQMLGSRLRDSDLKRAQFVTHDSGARIASRIIELADRFGEPIETGIRLNLPITQDEIALWAGCSREAVSKAMQAMRELRWIETGRRTILILDQEAVRSRATRD